MAVNKLHTLRKDYKKGILDVQYLPQIPSELFGNWMYQALEQGIPEPNAMTLSTVTADGRPSSRIVLLKEFSEKGFEFYTNYNSQKALHISQNPHVSLLFLWLATERQVRIEGQAQKVSRKKSVSYFATRPRESQLGAWVSEQSKIIESRAYLDARKDAFEKKFEGKVVSCPPYWGGYMVVPVKFEFWQGGPGRLHDRIIYEKEGRGWKVFRLAP